MVQHDSVRVLVFNKDIDIAESGDYEVTALFDDANYELVEKTATFVIAKPVPLGAILGGVGGGVAAMAILRGLAFFFIKKRRKLSIG